ncbi:MAG TPA: DUF4342 domain-containing protein [Thermoanaerobaculia bacterium]|nr:DUF4342 domain-containing protein [Thermoanaerobaculia bacterium]
MAESTSNAGTEREHCTTEHIYTKGEKLLQKVKELIHEGNVRRIIIKNEQGHTVVEVPLTVGVIGAVVAPVLAAVGAIAALVTNCTIIVERAVVKEDVAAKDEALV